MYERERERETPLLHVEFKVNLRTHSSPNIYYSKEDEWESGSLIYLSLKIDKG